MKNKELFNIGDKQDIIRLFGLVGVFTFPVFYVLWNQVMLTETGGFELRLISFLLCIPLALVKFWPQGMRKYLNVYWNASVFFCIPFFGTYMFLLNKGSALWSFNIICGLVWLALLTNWLEFLVQLASGIIVGFAYYVLLKGFPVLEGDHYSTLFFNYVWTVVIISLFSYSRDKIVAQKLQTAKALAGMITHEANTPLASLQMLIHQLRRSLSVVIEGFTKAVTAKVIPAPADEEFITDAAALPQDFDKQLHRLRFVINSLANNMKELNSFAHQEQTSLQALVKDAVEHFPFQSHEENIVQVSCEQDFSIRTDPDLFAHVLHNLIKNSLYAIHKADHQQGKITIAVGVKDGKGTMTFTDNGCGIPKRTLGQIFDVFVTTKRHGMGLGLAFVKKVVEASNGTIACTSTEGHSTTFTLVFTL